MIQKKGYHDQAHQTHQRATAATRRQQQLVVPMDFVDTFFDVYAPSLLPCLEK